ncbi:MAG TPA: lasso RiPP family leader peptide-containing protein [Longimicrobiales bacterium]
MYVKPRLERFGSVRQLTRIGCDPDADGGIWGIGNGSLFHCWGGHDKHDRS